LRLTSSLHSFRHPLQERNILFKCSKGGPQRIFNGVGLSAEQVLRGICMADTTPEPKQTFIIYFPQYAVAVWTGKSRRYTRPLILVKSFEIKFGDVRFSLQIFGLRPASFLNRFPGKTN